MKHKLLLVAGILLIVPLMMVSGAGRQERERPLIGLSMVQQDSDWWAAQNKMLTEIFAAAGWDTVTVWAAGDQSKQISDIEDLVAQKVDYIVMGPIQQEGSIMAVEASAKAGIPTILVARLSNNQNYLYAVMADEAEFGSHQIEQIHKDFPDGANMVYLFGPVGAGYAVQMWDEGVVPTLEKYPNLKLLDRYDHSGDITSQGLLSAEDAITRFGKDTIDIFVGTNDGLAMAAVRAVQAANLADDILVYGNGLTLMGMQALYDGQMEYTSLKSQAANAKKIIELMKDHMKGILHDQKIYEIPPVPITRENIHIVKDPIFGGTMDNPTAFQPTK